MDVCVAGGAMTAFNRRKDGSSFRDWARAAFDGAIADAGLNVSDIDAFVLGAESDFFTFQLNPASLIADELGLFGIQVQHVEGGGATGHLAVQAGATLVASGRARRVAVLGVEPSAAHLPAETIGALYSLSFDAWTDGMTGVDSTALYALSAQMFMAATGATADDFHRIAARNHCNALRNRYAHLPMEITVEDVAASPTIAAPYRRLDCSPLSDGAACLILARPEESPGAAKGRASIIGMAAANDRVRLGERSRPGAFHAKTLAARAAYREADVAPDQIGLAEVYDSYSGAQLQSLIALGLCDGAGDERNGRFDPSGSLPVNLSGGLIGQGAPVGATGVAQVLACAKQLEGRYWGHSPPAPPRFALADTHGGLATLCAVSVLKGPSS